MKGKNRDLYKNIASECGIMDDKSAMYFYYGLLRYIINELKENKKVILPEFGTFTVTKGSPHRIRDVNTNELKIVGGNDRVVFKPTLKMRNHFK